MLTREPKPRASDYPSLDMRRLFREWRTGSDLLVIWRRASDQRLGHAHLSWREDEARLILNWRVFRSPTLSRRGGEVQIDIRTRPSKIEAAKPLFACPACDGSCETVFYTDAGWACRKCQRLSYPTQLLKDMDRKELRIHELVRLGAKGPRPSGMWRSTHRRLRREYLQLRQELGDEALIAPRVQRSPVGQF